MMWRTHAETAVLGSIAVDAGIVAAGVPLTSGVVVFIVTLPIYAGYLSTVPDVDHHGAKIRWTVPPARWLYLLVVGLTWVALFQPWRPGWRERRRRAIDRWFDHRHIMHSYVTAFVLATLLELALFLWCWNMWTYALGPAWFVGSAGHIGGDCCTVSRYPIWAPFTWRRYGPGFIRTNSKTQVSILRALWYKLIYRIPLNLANEQRFSQVQRFACGVLVVVLVMIVAKTEGGQI